MTEHPKHFLDFDDLSKDVLIDILKHAHELKAQKFEPPQIFKGLSLGLFFDKRSTRTRISFDTAMKQLGGHCITLNKEDIHLGATESVKDTANVLSRYIDASAVRISSDEMLRELARHSKIPVINAMTDKSHPCQTMADVMTMQEKLGTSEGKKVVWFGDFTNVAVSLAQAAGIFDYEMVVAGPEQGMVRKADFKNVSFTDDPDAAIKGADVVVTDTWESMGEEGKSLDPFMPYQVNAALMAKANEGAIFMHCMPMHRGDEVTNEVADSSQSVVYDEAENRLHAQKAILAYCFEGTDVKIT